MTLDKAKSIKALVEEKACLEQLIEISTNYDFSMTAEFWSGHNCNRGYSAKKSCDLPRGLRNTVVDYVKTRLREVEEEIDKM